MILRSPMWQLTTVMILISFFGTECQTASIAKTTSTHPGTLLD
uniref:Uncharacterized protein n=1 Tax=Arundo donax TaxID=35708 RepID=A0A0A9A2J6_ARUDO